MEVRPFAYTADTVVASVSASLGSGAIMSCAIAWSRAANPENECAEDALPRTGTILPADRCSKSWGGGQPAITIQRIAVQAFADTRHASVDIINSKVFSLSQICQPRSEV